MELSCIKDTSFNINVSDIPLLTETRFVMLCVHCLYDMIFFPWEASCPVCRTLASIFPSEEVRKKKHKKGGKIKIGTNVVVLGVCEGCAQTFSSELYFIFKFDIRR